MPHGAHDHHRRRVFHKAAAEPFKQFKPVHPRHDELRDERIIMPGTQRIDRCLAIRHSLELGHLLLRCKAIPHRRLKLKISICHKDSIFCHSYASFLQPRCSFCLCSHHNTAIFAAIEHEFSRYCRVLLRFWRALSHSVLR